MHFLVLLYGLETLMTREGTLVFMDPGEQALRFMSIDNMESSG